MSNTIIYVVLKATLGILHWLMFYFTGRSMGRKWHNHRRHEEMAGSTGGTAKYVYHHLIWRFPLGMSHLLK
jgi:hypothetical protein